MFDYSLSTLHLHLTRNCNLSCHTCWISSGPHVEDTYIPPGIFQKIIDECGFLGLQEVKLSGGEPFTYPFLDQILFHCLQSGFRMRIETNGTLCNQHNLLQFTKFSDRLQFVISLDGSDSFVNSRLRGPQCDYNNVLNTCRLVKNLGF